MLRELEEQAREGRERGWTGGLPPPLCDQPFAFSFPSQDVDLLRVRGAGLELAVVPGADFVVASVQAAEG